MNRLKKYGKSPASKLIFLTLSILLVLFFVSCKKGVPSDITVYNLSGVTLDIYMDGILQFTVMTDGADVIREVPEGEHFLEAKLEGTGTILESSSDLIEDNGNYSWYIE